MREEFKENEDLPNTTNPDDWARISGRKGERIINVRTLMTGISRKERSIENIASGQSSISRDRRGAGPAETRGCRELGAAWRFPR